LLKKRDDPTNNISLVTEGKGIVSLKQGSRSKVDSSGSTVVEHSTRDPEIKGSNPAAGRKWWKKPV